MELTTFLAIFAMLVAVMLLYPPVFLSGLIAGSVFRQPYTASIAGALFAFAVFFALVFFGMFHLEMGRFPSSEGILAYFLAALFSGAVWAFMVRKLINWRFGGSSGTGISADGVEK